MSSIHANTVINLEGPSKAAVLGDMTQEHARAC